MKPDDLNAYSWTKFLELFKARCLTFGDFTLASGQKSTYYLDAKQVLFHPDGVGHLRDLLHDATYRLPPFQAVGGLEMGAVPMTVAFLGRPTYPPVEGFFVRKEAKGHGSQKLIEGRVAAGDRVVVLDDVLTTGGAALKAIAAVEALGATVVRVVCICDRLQGAAAALAGYDYRPLYTIEDLGIQPAGGRVS